MAAATGAGAALLALVFLSTAGLAEGLAYLGPAALMMALLLLGLYPGESALLAAPRARRQRNPRPADRRCRSVHTPSGRGGRLLAAALAGRAPPALQPQ